MLQERHDTRTRTFKLSYENGEASAMGKKSAGAAPRKALTSVN